MGLIKTMHLSCVVLSFSGFFIRGIQQIYDGVVCPDLSQTSIPCRLIRSINGEEHV